MPPTLRPEKAIPSENATPNIGELILGTTPCYSYPQVFQRFVVEEEPQFLIHRFCR